jgi:hypothetical protein
MAKQPKNHGKAWSDEEIEVIRQMVKANISGPDIGRKLGRTEDAIYAKAAEENIILRRKRRQRHMQTDFAKRRRLLSL